MQKVRGLISAFLDFTELFHFSFSFPLRYFLYRAEMFLFCRPYLGGKMVCLNGFSDWGVIGRNVLVLNEWASCFILRMTRLSRVPSQCKGDAVFTLATSWFLQVHLPVHLPCYDLPPLSVLRVLGTGLRLLGESDGRCVRASGPNSVGLSIPRLLLNPPSKFVFQLTIRENFNDSLNVAHLFPSHTLHLDLTFRAKTNCAHYVSFTG